MRNEIVVHIDTLLAARDETKVSRQPDRPTLGNLHHSNFAGLSRLQKIPITVPSVWSLLKAVGAVPPTYSSSVSYSALITSGPIVRIT
jgi:hypothetical protein